MCVLAVKDEPHLLGAVSQSLREGGYAVDGAADGEDGLFKATAWDYDAVVLDLMMPKRDGWSLLTTLRRTHKTPVHIPAAHVRRRLKRVVAAFASAPGAAYPRCL